MPTQANSLRDERTALNRFKSARDAVDSIRNGGMVLLVSGGQPEPIGNLVMAADHASAESIDSMMTVGSGLIRVAMAEGRLTELRIPPTISRNCRKRERLHVGLDHAQLRTTGGSAQDRAKAVRALAEGSSVTGDFRQPGHVFPPAYEPGGVLRRAGRAKASVDLAVLAGCSSFALLCEIVVAYGQPVRPPSCLN